MQCRHLDGDQENNRLENLAWGTSADNGVDKILLDEAAKGESHGMSRLSDDDVREAWRMKSTGLSATKIAQYFMVHPTTIQRIFNGATWRHIIAAR
jgi:hypothetical protein